MDEGHRVTSPYTKLAYSGPPLRRGKPDLLFSLVGPVTCNGICIKLYIKAIMATVEYQDIVRCQATRWVSSLLHYQVCFLASEY